ncbi:MAG: HupE/UreJ family protein [Gammaproteobacteria bacterium]
MKAPRWIVLGLLALWVGQACAETQSVSYSTWVISGKTVTLRFLLPVPDAQRLIGRDMPVATVAKLAQYLLGTVSVRSASGACEALDQGYDLGRVDPLSVGAGLYGFEIFYRCEDPRQIVLRDDALFARIPDHLHIARVYQAGRDVEHLFTASDRQWQLPDDGALRRPDAAMYLRLGAERVLRNADLLCVVLGLALVIRRRRDLAYAVLALALGYSASIAISQAGWITPVATPVHAFVGLLAALAALAVVLARTEKRRPIVAGWIGLLLLAAIVAASIDRAAAAWLLLGGAVISAGFSAATPRGETSPMVAPLLAAVLGFLDGFLWAAAIEPARLASQVEVSLLTSINLGALLIETVVAGLLVGALLLFRMRGFERTRAFVIDASAAVVAGCGTFWLATRLWV